MKITLRRRWIGWFAVIMLLWLLFAQALNAARAASITFDEGPHLAVGYTTLRTGDWRLQPIHIHPPLANVWAAAPLLLNPDLPDPRTVPGWEIASLSAVTDAVVWGYPQPARLALAGRLPIILLTILTGALVFRWAADLGGRGAGLLALGLYAFDPNIIAHGALVTTDMAVTALGLLTFFLLSRYLRRPSPARLTGIGLALGLALASKVSAALLLMVIGLVLLLPSIPLPAFLKGRNKNDVSSGSNSKAVVEIASPREKRPRLLMNLTRLFSSLLAEQRDGAQQGLGYYPRKAGCGPLAMTSQIWNYWSSGGRADWQGRLRAWVIVVVLAGLTLWAVYGFQVRSLPELADAGPPLSWLAQVPLPAATHLEIYRSLQEHYELGHPAFLMGQNSAQGWWIYFPVAFAVKTPLPTLILLGVALLLFVKRWQPQLPVRDLALLLFPPIYAGTALLSSVDIGYRHLLPILPFVHIFIGATLPRPASLRARFDIVRALLLAGLVLWLVVGTIGVQPYPLTYFNALASGPAGGYRWLVDSNLDWGQNLWDLSDWMQDKNASRVYYSHFSPAHPQVYGVNADWLPPDPRAVPFTPWDPAPGTYAIGATTLQGVYTPDVNTFAWFRNQEPVTRLGEALFLYTVPAREPLVWAAVCTQPTPVLSAEAVRASLGRPELRVIPVDCAQSWIYPAVGSGPAAYIWPPDATPPPHSSLEVAARQSDGEPLYSVYRGQIDDSFFSTASTTEGVEALEGPLALLSARVQATHMHPSETVELLWTVWQVQERTDRPLSLMAHLIGVEGTPVIVADGLGVPVQAWQPGDILVQRHRFAVPADTPAGEYILQIGAYWLDTMARWTIHLEDGSTCDALHVDKVTIMD